MEIPTGQFTVCGEILIVVTAVLYYTFSHSRELEEDTYVVRNRRWWFVAHFLGAEIPLSDWKSSCGVSEMGLGKETRPEPRF